MSPLLSATSITLRQKRRILLQDVTLSVSSGDVLGLIGPNGAGKTTMLRLLAGLIAPDAGTVALEGRPIARFTTSERSRKIAYLPQENAPETTMTVREIVALGRLPHIGRETPQEREAAIARAICHVGLEGFENRPFNRISGGERARLLLARALAVDAPLILADEPVASLDPAHALSVMKLFQSMAGAGRAVVVILHDLTLAARFCTHLAVLADGKLAATGTPEDVLTDRIFASVYGVTVRRSGGALVPWDRL